MATYIRIGSKVTVGAGGASSIDFSSIPNTYTDLVLKTSLRINAGGDWCFLTINGSSSNFTGKELTGAGTSVNVYDRTTNNFIVITDKSSYTANSFSSGEHYFPNYAGSNYKSFQAHQGQETDASGANIMIDNFLWSSTSAINQLTITPSVGSFEQYSTATLYGIKNS